MSHLKFWVSEAEWKKYEGSHVVKFLSSFTSFESAMIRNWCEDAQRELRELQVRIRGYFFAPPTYALNVI